MPRLRRRTIATYNMATRYNETPTRALCRRSLEEMTAGIITRAFSEQREKHGLPPITLTPDEIEQRGIKLSAARPIWNDLGTEQTHWQYDITALI